MATDDIFRMVRLVLLRVTATSPAEAHADKLGVCPYCRPGGPNYQAAADWFAATGLISLPPGVQWDCMNAYLFSGPSQHKASFAVRAVGPIAITPAWQRRVPARRLRLAALSA